MQSLPKLMFATIILVQVVFADFSAWNHSEKIFLRTGTKGVQFNRYVKKIPIPIRLDASFFDFSQAKPNGEDIRFSDSSGTEALNYEIERWDPAAGKAEIWVVVERIHKNRDDQFIQMHWGNPAAESLSDGPSVFQSGRKFEGVYHMNENPPGKGNVDAIKDAGQNRHKDEYLHGTDYLSQGETREMIGPAPRFNQDSSDYVVIPQRGDWNVGTSGYSYSLWVRMSGRSLNDWARLLSKDDDNDSLRVGGNMIIQNQKFPAVHLFTDTTSEVADSTIRYELVTNTDISDGRWHHIAMVEGSRSVSLFVDGKIRVDLPPLEGKWKNDAAMYFGAFLGEEYFFDGWMDEIWLIRDAKPNEFIKMIYETQRPDQKVVHFGEPVPQLAVITLQPEPVSLLTGESLALTVSVNSEETPEFQWFKDGSVVSGAVSNSLLIDSVKLTDGGKYHVTVTNPAGTVSSDTVMVEVNVSPPKIVNQPQSQPAKPGTAATFSVTATGEGQLSYQWLLNGEAVNGATGSTYTVSPVTFPMNGDVYSCRVTNLGGSITSEDALLTVTVNECENSFSASAPEMIPETSSLILAGFAECTSTFGWLKLSGPEWGAPKEAKMTDTILVPRISEARELTYRFSAKIGDKWLYKDLKVVVNNNIPDPVFVMNADSVWEMTSPLDITYSVENLAELEAAGVANITHRWFFSGIEADTVPLEKGMRFSNPLEEGEISVGLCLQNGGEEICHVNEITVHAATRISNPSNTWNHYAVTIQNGEIVWNRKAAIRILNLDGRTLLRTIGNQGDRLSIKPHLQAGLNIGRYQVLIED